ARIVPVTDAFRRYMVDAGVQETKIEVVKNGVEFGLFDRSRSGKDLRARLGLEGRFVAAYFGTHGMAHHLETIFEAARLLADDERIVFMMVGDGAEKARLAEMRGQLGLDNVLMLDQQPKAAMPEFWAMADASLVLLRRADLFKTVIPSKIFEAMGMATPIVLGVDGEAREIVEAAGGGIFIEPENATQLADAVRRLADDPELGAKMGDSAHDYVRTYFDRRVLAHRYLDVLKGVATAPT
ncbi:MAG: glycosyltransferase family 4 protein, partial [Gammaproteobacteria bacterium]|nr:glycosyltransferase family 4 protein [Gammaproteobacteria bacterium]